ncbi:hypothetical protein AAFC00_006543 [Neodothiora populina]|uniref:S-adenosyl-L-methionine-dependent methyltransferase n=1 Tax=Neodothiora populina TaxID=2781224 RepID=A0ABR3PAC8_9PEZI
MSSSSQLQLPLHPSVAGDTPDAEAQKDSQGQQQVVAEAPPTTNADSDAVADRAIPRYTHDWLNKHALQSQPEASAVSQPGSPLLPSTNPLAAESIAASNSSASNLVIGQSLLVDSHENSEIDSALGSEDRDRLSSTASLNSTVLEYRFANGRRYHAFEDDAYHLPNDEQEIDRLDIQHLVWSLTLQKRLHIAPLTSNTLHDVLDVGTGVGNWAIEFADLHPQADVIGTDLSPIQPAWTPPNCSFLIDNAEDEWVYERQFDFVHSRMLLMGMHDWPRYFRQAWKHLRPGGWIEVQEVQFPVAFADDDSVPPDSPLLVWSQRVREAAAKAGIDTMCSTQFKSQLQRQGFVNIKEKWPKWALGPWPRGHQEKEIGVYTLENTKQFVSAIALKLWTKYLDWSPEAVEMFLVEVRKDLDDRKKHYYWQMAILAAQKPPTAST